MWHRKSNFVFFYRLSTLFVLSMCGIISCTSRRTVELPYNNYNTVIYDNDDASDMYTDEYMMALASAGDIKLTGIITSSSIAPFNKWVTSDDYDLFVTERSREVRHARNSMFGNIPDPVRGPEGYLQKPTSGHIEDTQPLGAEGSYLIVQEARKAHPSKPLVIVMGGPLTLAADAYLLENSIADKVVIAWLGGREGDMGEYNGVIDPWAAYIVLQKLRLVQFPGWSVGVKAAPSVPKARLVDLPNTALRQWMLDKQHQNGLPDERDGDAPPAIALMQRKYVLQTKRVSFSHWITESGRELPAFKEDPGGRALVVTKASKDVATKEWWRALKNPAAW